VKSIRDFLYLTHEGAEDVALAVLEVLVVLRVLAVLRVCLVGALRLHVRCVDRNSSRRCPARGLDPQWDGHISSGVQGHFPIPAGQRNRRGRCCRLCCDERCGRLCGRWCRLPPHALWGGPHVVRRSDDAEAHPSKYIGFGVLECLEALQYWLQACLQVALDELGGEGSVPYWHSQHLDLVVGHSFT